MEAYGGGGGGTTTYGYYYSCYYDSYGTATTYGTYCDYYATYCDYYWTTTDEQTTCLDSVYGCDGVQSCYMSALCNADATCEAYFNYYASTGGRKDTLRSYKSRAKNLKAVPAVGSFTFNNAVLLYGEDTVGTSYPIYCDHSHLYDFYYDTVTPMGTSDVNSDLAVTAHSMIGFPGLCSYSDGIAISSDVTEGVKVATTGDEFAWTCGYYVEYEWSGLDDVYFEVDTLNAVRNAVSAMVVAAFILLQQ